MDEMLAAESQAVQSHQNGGLEGMLAGSDDEGLFGAQEQSQPQQATESSAMAQWEAEKREELKRMDETEEKANEELKKKVRDESEKFTATLRDAQEKREKQNKEIDDETLQKNGSDNKWEGVAGYIDFNRSDLHEKDVSRMKSLLLQLKQ